MEERKEMEKLRTKIEETLKKQSHEEWECKCENNNIQCFFKNCILFTITPQFKIIVTDNPYTLRDLIIVKDIVHRYK